MIGRSGSGVVTAFDEGQGLGEVLDEQGRRRSFHCTQIADGTRLIAVGTGVRFTVIPGHGGQWEAAELVAVSSAATDAR